MAIKIFVGGIPSGTTASELAQRFAPFGKHGMASVTAQLIGPKTYDAAPPYHDKMSFDRNFGFVVIDEPKDEASARRAVQVSF